MNWELASQMVAISAAVSAGMVFVVSLMIREALAQATSRITKDLHELLDEKYVLKEVYRRDMREIREGMKYLAGRQEESTAEDQG